MALVFDPKEYKLSFPVIVYAHSMYRLYCSRGGKRSFEKWLLYKTYKEIHRRMVSEGEDASFWSALLGRIESFQKQDRKGIAVLAENCYVLLDMVCMAAFEDKCYPLFRWEMF